MQGLFISFEGLDGAGKTTQVQLLADLLISSGHKVTVTREPGGTPLGDKIRTLLLDLANSEMCAETEALLYAAARAQHVTQVIAPALARGEIVITDRYTDSTVVYQGVARTLNKNQLEALNEFAVKGVMPDLTILLDAEVALLQSRLAGRGECDRIEQEDVKFHEAVRQGFLALAARHSRIKVVPALGEQSEVQAAIATVVRQFLKEKRI
ncbi:MAG: thymidylate kinase [Anaerosporomusa subterranea]|jgi:dTMP kinase|nr:thymidylate kinase [Anaerosporomusa subterranea]